jgi:hypothetical protein
MMEPRYYQSVTVRAILTVTIDVGQIAEDHALPIGEALHLEVRNCSKA